MTTAKGDIEDQVARVAQRLRERRWRVATAESCTGGWVGMALTAPPGASHYYVGGVVAYADAVKETALGVAPEALVQDGAVSETVARQMARGVAERLKAEVGLAVTGVAGPDGGSPAKPVGTVWMAVHSPHGTAAELQRFEGDREAVRRAAALHVLGMVLRAVQ